MVPMDTDNSHTIARAAQPVGRFAPTPSGRMHLGNAFSSLMAWLAARSAGGRMVMRIEDLDPRTRNPERARQIIDDLAWLGLDWDEGPSSRASAPTSTSRRSPSSKEPGSPTPASARGRSCTPPSAPTRRTAPTSTRAPAADLCARRLPSAALSAPARHAPARARAQRPTRAPSTSTTSSMAPMRRCSPRTAATFSCDAATASSPTSLPWWSTTRSWA